jgi:hypothetical protein
MAATASAVAGSYYFTATFGSTASGVATLTVVSSALLPQPPTISSAVAASGRVAISWTETGIQPSLYNLYWAAGSTVTTTTGTKVANIINSSYTVTGLTNGTQYAFIVTGVNSYGEGSPSTVVTATPVVSWSVIGNTLSYNPAYFSLVCNNGTPYIAYRDSSAGGYLTVAMFNGTNWVPVGSAGFSAGTVGEISLAFDSSGTPYVAYRDFAYNQGATVMKYNGASWSYVGSPGFTPGQAFFITMAIYNGAPYVAFEDASNNNEATVETYNGSNWVYVGSADFSTGQAAYTSIAIDPSGTPYVVYQDGSLYSPVTAKSFSAGNWVTVGSADFSGTQCAWYPSIAIDAGGTPYVSYGDYANSNLPTVKKFNGTNWVTVGSTGFCPSAVQTSVRIYNGMPYLACGEPEGNTPGAVMKYDGSSWSMIGNSNFASSAVSPCLALDSNGIPYVAYVDGTSRYLTVQAYK